MRAHVIEGGKVTNTILVDSLDAFPNLIDAEQGGTIGDSWDGQVFTKPAPPPPTVPASVTRRQAKQALLLAGLLSHVQPAIDAIPDATQRGMAQIEWDESLEFERSRPLLINLATALGLSSEQLDALFIQAAAL